MKKVLVSLLVLALAMTSVFAAVNFSGEFKAGYTFGTADWKNWDTGIFGQDNLDSDVLKLNASLADENGIWSITMKGALVADNRLAGTATVDLGKVFMGADSDVSIALALVANNRVAGLNAYNNASGFNMTRIRTLDKGLWTSLTVGYGDYVQVQVAGGPDNRNMFWATYDEIKSQWDTKTGADFIASALVKPVDGIGVSIGYVLSGEDKWADAGDSKMNAAVDVDIAALADLDFALGVSVGDRFTFEGKSNVFATTVYGGVDFLDFSAEYSLISANKNSAHNFNVGLGFNVVDGLKLNVYTGAFGLREGAKFKDAFFVGGNVGYTVAGVGLNLNVQYSGANSAAYLGDVAQGGVKNVNGFAVTPSMSIAW